MRLDPLALPVAPYGLGLDGDQHGLCAEGFAVAELRLKGFFPFYIPLPEFLYAPWQQQ
ncbi:hypothetical protein ABE571_04470 [Stenotrophomonas sp. TWI273]|uniref:hypothetical protein n=1 Tax=Stenotrophomonas sp. TWI273 TaxID=3136774 RepID=UPI003207B548